jgi:hypothetical protein
LSIVLGERLSTELHIYFVIISSLEEISSRIKLRDFMCQLTNSEVARISVGPGYRTDVLLVCWVSQASVASDITKLPRALLPISLFVLFPRSMQLPPIHNVAVRMLEKVLLLSRQQVHTLFTHTLHERCDENENESQLFSDNNRNCLRNRND